MFNTYIIYIVCSSHLYNYGICYAWICYDLLKVQYLNLIFSFLHHFHLHVKNRTNMAGVNNKIIKVNGWTIMGVNIWKRWCWVLCFHGYGWHIGIETHSYIVQRNFCIIVMCNNATYSALKVLFTSLYTGINRNTLHIPASIPVL